MIAISYRREDSLPTAGRLYDRLQAEFGKGNVFMDFDSIPYGVDFREHIKQMIDGSRVLVALIGPDWFGKRRQKKRRIDDPGDFVRLEIAYALERGLPIIPVLINDTPMPKASDLPPDIEALAFRNAVTLSVGIDFHHHADRLVVGIDGLVRKAREAAAIPKATGPPVAPRIERPFVAGLFQEHESHPAEPSGSAPKMRTGPTQLPRESAPPSRVEKSPGEPGWKPTLQDSRLKRDEPPIERWSYWRQLWAEIQQKWTSISQRLRNRTDPVSRGGIFVLVLLVTAVLYLYFGSQRSKDWLQRPIIRTPSTESATDPNTGASPTTPAPTVSQGDPWSYQPPKAGLSEADSLLNEASALRAKGDLTNALFKLQGAADRDPKNARVLAEIAAIYESMGSMDRSNETWRKIQEIGPSAGDLYATADKRVKLGPAAMAAPTTPTVPAPRADILAPNVAFSKAELGAMYDKAFREFDSNNFPEALKDLDAIDARQPNLAESYNLRGVIFMRQGIYDRAETALLKAIRINPKFWNAQFNLSEIPFLKKEWGKARAGFQELLSSHAGELEGDTSQLIQFKILLTYLIEGKENMVDSILAKFELSPDTPAVHYANAAIALQRKNSQEAKDWVMTAEKNFSPQLNKLFVESLYEIGWLEKPAGQTRAALELTSAAERSAKSKAFAASKFEEAGRLIPSAKQSPIPFYLSAGKIPEARHDQSWQEWIGDFVRQFVSANQLHDVDATLVFYAPNVDYFDDHQKDQAYIRSDIETYNQRWPVRYDWIEGDLMLSEKTPERDYAAGFKLNFYAGSTERALWSQGQFAINLDITVTDGIPQISGIKEKVLRQEKGILQPGSPSAESSPPADAKRNSFGIREGSYVCQYVAAPKTRRVDDKASGKKDVVRVTYGSKIVINGNRFSHVFSLDQQPTPAGAGRWPRIRYAVQADGEIFPSGDGYVLKPNRVTLVEKLPKDLPDSKTSIARDRQRLPDTKWTVRYEETRLVQTSNGELWSLENPGNH